MSDVRARMLSDDPQAIADYANDALESAEEEAAIPVVRAAAERPKPNAERLREYADASLPRIEQ